jgi:hypothetical protein
VKSISNTIQELNFLIKPVIFLQSKVENFSTLKQINGAAKQIPENPLKKKRKENIFNHIIKTK